MTRPAKVLWIEDEADSILPHLIVHAELQCGHIVVNAPDATHAMSQLYDDEFDVVILDVRLPPGMDEKWIRRFQGAAGRTETPRLGIELIKEALADNDPKASWLTPEKIAVFTVEPPQMLENEMQELGIATYRRKTIDVREEELSDLISAVLGQSGDH